MVASVTQRGTIRSDPLRRRRAAPHRVLARGNPSEGDLGHLLPELRERHSHDGEAVVGVTTMQVTLRHWPGMKLSWLGAGAVLHSGDDPTPSAAQLVVSPHGSTECAVVIGSHNVKLQPEMVEGLAEVLAHGLPRGFSTMRFVAGAGAFALGD